MNKYRSLSTEEIGLLEARNCYCSDWSLVSVIDGFRIESLRNVTFSGSIKIGQFNRSFTFPGGVEKKAGISNATLHNCIIESDAYINQVKNHIANYHIHSNVVIENVDSIITEKQSCFGNGVPVSALNEAGGREIYIYNDLSAHTAYIMAMYRHEPAVIQQLQKMINDYKAKICSSMGTIQEGAQLINCRTIIDINIGKFAKVEGIYRLTNGTINSSAEAPSYFGPGVIAEEFIAASGSKVSDSALLSKCFVGQGCELGKHYSAENSVFFANSQGFHGEACSVFAGPYTVTHHKSTLLIAGYFSFMNAGSGSNQSNHMYKLGPIHQGVVERGSKTTSDSYLLWPAHIGAFSLVMGRHYRNPDTSQLPFSYLIENKDESILAPGVNLRSVGTIRDARKWPKRDKRTDTKLLDYINFNLLSPFTIQKMINGKKVLKALRKSSGATSDYYMYNSVKIESGALVRGIQLYNTGIIKFLGNALIKKLEDVIFESLSELRQSLSKTSECGIGEWIDMAGMLVPKERVKTLLDDLQNGSVSNLEELNGRYALLHDNYFDYAWTWCLKVFKEEYDLDFQTAEIDQILSFVDDWKKSVIDLDNMVYADAHKEFTLNTQTGFGIDGTEETRIQDFEQVRGEFEKHPSVQDISNHIRVKSRLAEELKERLILLK
ncbi:DUF4954 family protein [Carboxylicivirga sp. M1479]|uniref:DUF4954 family protein n=1 Tax=Carboxylicivirga sp. M1479 TaxID=2594476 RepID=UPI0011789B8F|nr:DUF4954 family protein [Carboxylicivirga sp. M1479]TRX72418.1 DUF4954 family protein [Carboxylicivirga sp. M1479]